MGSRVRIRLFHLHLVMDFLFPLLEFLVMDFLFPLLKNSKSGVDDRGHCLRITHTLRRSTRLRRQPVRYGQSIPSEHINDYA